MYIPSLLYGFDACALTKSELSSLDFIVNRFQRAFENTRLEIYISLFDMFMPLLLLRFVYVRYCFCILKIAIEE